MPPIELLLLLLLLATAGVVARLHDLFAAAMLTGIVSLLAAGLFVLMDAVDVAFTEAAVGAGIGTVLILGALSLTSRREKPGRMRILPLVIVAATGATLIYGTWDMPAYGDGDAVIHHHLAPELIAETAREDPHPEHRHRDPGQLPRLRHAGRGRGDLHRRRRRRAAPGRARPAPEEGRTVRPLRVREMPVLRVVGRALVPLILLFGLYVQFHGDFGPGGGFQAGVIFAAGLIVYALIFGLEALQQVVPPILTERLMAAGRPALRQRRRSGDVPGRRVPRLLGARPAHHRPPRPAPGHRRHLNWASASRWPRR